MKPAMPHDTRQRVLELRRSHSMREVASQTGLPLGTVKTICSRSGAFRDNPEHRAMFSLPAVKASTSTALAIPTLPEPKPVTGDKDLDGLLWLHEVMATGDSASIAKAKLAVTRIKTPLKVLEARYKEFLQVTNPGNPFAVFPAIGLADMDDHAKTATSRSELRHEALARFGTKSELFDTTPAEAFCAAALDGLQRAEQFGEVSGTDAAERFRGRPNLMPNTLSDCVHELRYWRKLGTLRERFFVGGSDMSVECRARDGFVFSLLAEVRPRSRQEAVDTLRYMMEDEDEELLARPETEQILHNLVGGA